MIVLYILLGILAVLLGIALVRTALIKAPAPVSYTPEVCKEACDIAVEKLGAMIRVPTVSKSEDEDLTQFYQFHDELVRLFPKLHEKLEKTVLLL